MAFPENRSKPNYGHGEVKRYGQAHLDENDVSCSTLRQLLVPYPMAFVTQRDKQVGSLLSTLFLKPIDGTTAVLENHITKNVISPGLKI